MKQEELNERLRAFAIGILNGTEILEIKNFGDYVKKHFKAIPKNDLVVGETYKGNCRNANEGVWDGEKFHIRTYECGFEFEQTINHYEDDNEFGYDVFVPVETV